MVEVVPLTRERLLLYASRLVGMGFAVIFLHSPAKKVKHTKDGPVELPPKRRGKTPIAYGWASQPALDVDDLLRLLGQGEPGYNLSIRTGRVPGAAIHVIVVDLDSDAAVAWAEAHLPPTEIKTLTGGGGQHWFYRMPAGGGRIGNKARIEGVEIDIRGDEGQVVAPGSVHGTGTLYKAPMPWSPERLASMPTFDKAWFAGAEWDGEEDPVVADGGSRVVPVQVDIATRQERAMKYLEHASGTVAGESAGSACLYIARALVYGLCLPPEEAARLMCESGWNSRCSGADGEPYPWTLHELSHKCRDAYTLRFNKPYGYLLLDSPVREEPLMVGKAKLTRSPAKGAAPKPAAAKKQVKRTRGKVEEPDDSPPAERPTEIDLTPDLTAAVKEAADVEALSEHWDFQPEETPVKNPGDQGWPCTDTGNAERLAARFGAGVRYAEDREIWMAWDGQGRWIKRQIAMERASKVVARKISEEFPAAEKAVAVLQAKMLSMPEGDSGRDAIVVQYDAAVKHLKHLQAWQWQSESGGHRGAMIRWAASESNIAVGSSVFDHDQWALNCRNGTLDLRHDARVKLRPHDRRDYQTKMCPVAYDEAAACPTWLRCLEQWHPEPGVVEFLQRWAGYCLTGDCSAEAMLICVGVGANGKSTFTNAIRSILAGYATSAPAGLLMETRQDKATPSQQAGLAALVAIRYCAASESEESASISEAQVKAITGKDQISACRKFEAPFDYVPSHKTTLNTNWEPVISGTDEGIWRRVLLLKWTFQATAKDRDDHLGAKLLAERPGILAWAVRGCIEWQKAGGGLNGLCVPESMILAHKKYRSTQDTLGSFLSDSCDLSPGYFCPKGQFREAYEHWCDQHGARPFGVKRLIRELEAKSIGDGRNSDTRLWLGVKLKDGH